MKQCPTCNRVFDDETLTVCPDDGSALVSARETPTTQGFDTLGGKATWSPSQDQIAKIQQYVTTTKQPQRKIWPWLVIAVVVLVILIGLGLIVVTRL
jgi:hypothetical protein